MTQRVPLLLQAGSVISVRAVCGISCKATSAEAPGATTWHISNERHTQMRSNTVSTSVVVCTCIQSNNILKSAAAGWAAATAAAAVVAKI